MQFLDLASRDRKRLERLVEGIQDGSVSESIRRNARENGNDLLRELRKRPANQKLMFATNAQAAEIDASILDGSQSAIQRLLDNPRLTSANVRQILRSPAMTNTIVATIARGRKWFGDEEVRMLFCVHPAARLDEALRLLPRLSRSQLAIVSQSPNLRPQLRAKAKQLHKPA